MVICRSNPTQHDVPLRKLSAAARDAVPLIFQIDDDAFNDDLLKLSSLSQFAMDTGVTRKAEGAARFSTANVNTLSPKVLKTHLGECSVCEFVPRLAILQRLSLDNY